MVPDAQPHRRRSDASMDRRVTVLERDFAHLVSRMDVHLTASNELHRDARALINKLDERADRADIMFARIIAVVAVLVTVANFVAPLVISWLERSL